MAQSVKVIRQTLTATGSGTTDFTSTGFGTVAAAIIIVCNANSTNNPEDDAVLGVGFWDGTNQRAVGIKCTDNLASSQTGRSSNDASCLLHGDNTTFHYSVSAVTDGIQLTMDVDNTSLQRYATVILLGGVSASVGTFTPNATQNATQASGSLGFAPELVFFVCIGATTADTAALGQAIFSFGLAATGITNRCVLWCSETATANEEADILFSENRCVGQIFNGATSWTGEITALGADSFTMTTRDGGSGSDVCFYLALGGDLSAEVGTLTTPTSTGNNDTALGIDPDALLTFLTTATGTTLASDSSANGLNIGMADGAGQYSHSTFVEDAAANMNTGSVASATALVNLDTSSGGSRADMIDGTVTLGTAKFTINYSAVDGTARKGWYVAFGETTGGGGGGANPWYYYQQAG